MLEAVFVGAVAAVLLVVPGFVCATVLARRLPILDRISLATPISIAMLFGFASILSVLGAPVSMRTVALPVLGVAMAVFATGLVRKGLPPAPRVTRTHVLLVLIMVLASTLWIVSIGDMNAVPPFDDGANHGIFTRRILESGTLDPRVVVNTDLAVDGGGNSYYPLALHLAASFVVTLTGAETGLAIHGVVVVTCAVLGPIAMFAFVRRVVEVYVPSVASTPAALTAALIAATSPFGMWAHVLWGGFPLITAIALMPAVLLAFVLVLRGTSRSSVLLGLAAFGSFCWHNSEIVTAAILALGLLLGAGAANLSIRSVLRSLVVAGGVALLLVLPLLPSLSGALGERIAGDTGAPVGPFVAIGRSVLYVTSGALLFDPLELSSLLACVIAVSALVLAVAAVWRVPELGGLLIASAVIVVVAWGCIAGYAVAQRLGTLWYSNGYRMLTTLLPVFALLLGVAVSAVMTWVSSTRSPLRLVVALGGVIYATLMLGVSLSFGTSAFRDFSVVTAADRATYSWVGATTQGQGRVLNDSHDGSMWMYDLGGANPVFGPKSDVWDEVAFASRRYLRDHIGDIDTDPQVRVFAAGLSVRYVAVGERVVRITERQLDLDAISSSQSLREVFRAGDARIYEILPAPTN